MTANNDDGTPPQQTDVKEQTPTNNNKNTNNTKNTNNNNHDDEDKGPLSRAHGDQRREYDLFVKLLCLGDSGVGKTSMLKRLVDDAFDNDFKATVGIDFYEKILDYDPKKQETFVNNTAAIAKSMLTLA